MITNDSIAFASRLVQITASTRLMTLVRMSHEFVMLSTVWYRSSFRHSLAWR